MAKTDGGKPSLQHEMEQPRMNYTWRYVTYLFKNGSPAGAFLVMLICLLTLLNETLFKPRQMTFAKLVDLYIDFKVKPAEYRNERKIAGLRSVRTVRYRITPLVEYFGDRQVQSITPGEIHKYKEDRLNTPTKYGGERKIATVQRELEVLRAILNYAKSEGWINHSPFERTPTPLISKADETKRERVLSEEEEARLLAACSDDSPRGHIRGIIIAALDTGMRQGELLKLVWSAIDLQGKIIRIKATNAKNMRSRSAPVTGRLADELVKLPSFSLGNSEASVFNLTKFQHSWETACRLAEIEDITFHDLRHTFATRLMGEGVSIEEISKMLGHTDIRTTFRHYLHVTTQTISRVAGLLNSRAAAKGNGKPTPSDNGDNGDDGSDGFSPPPIIPKPGNGSNGGAAVVVGGSAGGWGKPIAGRARLIKASKNVAQNG